MMTKKIKFKVIHTFIIANLLFMGMISHGYSQKIDFSVYLASSDEVWGKASSVSDKKGNIFVVGATRSGLKVTVDAYQKKYKGNDTRGGGGSVFNETVIRWRIIILNIHWRIRN